MPANRPYNITVHANFSGVSYNPNTNTWTGTPAWNVTPPHQSVPPIKAGQGDNIITWNLNATSLPAGFTAAFSPTPIVFKETPPWTGSAPANNANGSSCSVTDDFNGLVTKVVFKYTITVRLTDLAGYSDFQHDPDVENQSGTVNVPTIAIVRTEE